MQSIAIQPSIYTTDERIIISIPKFLFWKKFKLNKTALDKEDIKSRGFGIEALRGCLADVPAFKNKTSVEVQHMATDLWAKKYSS